MPLASIDIGTNTIRLLIGKIEAGKIVRLRTVMAITRLGKGINETGALGKESIDRSISALKEFSRLISEYKVSRLKAVGTSALREASNAGEFVKTALEETGIKIDAISGHAEAELTATGVLFDLDAGGSSLIIDIGGGSAEWILCGNSTPVRVGTMPVGVVKLFEAYIKSDPPSRNDAALLNREVSARLKKLKDEIGGLIGDDTHLIGTAGTITTLASMDLGLETYSHEKVHGHRMSAQRLREISTKLAGLSLRERKKLKGLDPERADLIIPGILFTINVMKTFDFKNILVSDNGLLEGVMIKLSGNDS